MASLTFGTFIFKRVAGKMGNQNGPNSCNATLDDGKPNENGTPKEVNTKRDSLGKIWHIM